jgi:hypothetical protein
VAASIWGNRTLHNSNTRRRASGFRWRRITDMSSGETDAHRPHDEEHANHIHGVNCGHEAVTHDDHFDYIHDGHRHASHGDHYDEHGD